MRIKFSLLAVSLLGIASVASADSLSVGQIAQQLKQDAAIPLAPSVGNQLAKNLLAAQAAAPYTQFEPDSLQLSIDAVLKAIGLYVFPGGPAMITDEASEPVVWIQSRIAIDDRLSGGFDVTSFDFGSQPVATPEPTVWIGLLLGFTLLATYQLVTRNTRLRNMLLIGNSLLASTSLTAQEQPKKDGVRVELIAMATEYVPRTTTISHAGHSYTDCRGNTDYFGQFSNFGDFGSVSGSATTNTHCTTTFSPPSESTRTTYRRLNYTLVKDDRTLYLLSCTQEWRLSNKTGLLIAAIGGSEAVDKAEANGSGHWTDCPAFSIGAEYALTVRSASDARLESADMRKPAKLEYLGAAPVPTAPAHAQAAPTVQTHVADKPATATVHVSSSPTAGEIYVDGKFSATLRRTSC